MRVVSLVYELSVLAVCMVEYYHKICAYSTVPYHFLLFFLSLLVVHGYLFLTLKAVLMRCQANLHSSHEYLLPVNYQHL